MKATLALVFAALILPASARIGETLDRCVARYGEVQREEKGGFKIFHKSGFEIGINFRDGKAVCLGMVRQRKLGERAAEITQAEIDVVLAANGGGSEWLRLPGSLRPEWVTADGLVTAAYTPSDRTLFLITRDESERSERERAEKQKDALKGF